MSIRGEIVIECDQQGCHAEIVLQAEDFTLEPESRGTDISVYAYGWHTDDFLNFICPQCAEGDSERDEAYERAAARARNNDFADTGGKDWT